MPIRGAGVDGFGDRPSLVSLSLLPTPGVSGILNTADDNEPLRLTNGENTGTEALQPRPGPPSTRRRVASSTASACPLMRRTCQVAAIVPSGRIRKVLRIR